MKKRQKQKKTKDGDWGGKGQKDVVPDLWSGWTLFGETPQIAVRLKKDRIIVEIGRKRNRGGGLLFLLHG